MPPGTTPSPAQTARVLHAALIIVPAVFTAGVAIVVRARPMPPVGGATIQVVMVVVALVLAGVAVFFGSRVPSRARGDDPAAYWRRALPAMIVVWATLESSALLAAVAGLLTGTVVIPIAGLLGFLVLMTMLSPRRLAGQ